MKLLCLSTGMILLPAFLLPFPGWGQPAPAPRVVVPADSAPETMREMFATQEAGPRTITMPGAAWLQLQFGAVNLGPDGQLVISGSDGEEQIFTQSTIDAWEGLTAVFNGSELTVEIRSGTSEAGVVSAPIADIIVGLPQGEEAQGQPEVPSNLRQLLGPDLQPFTPSEEETAQPSRESGAAEAICGANDDRVGSNDPRVGRIMPIGCTGWLIEGGAFLTAGHCVTAAAQTIEFNVPASTNTGTTVAPPVRDQYRIIGSSFVTQNTGVGNDWAVFRVLPNTQTGLMPLNAQGSAFRVSDTENPTQVRITGYGVDGPAPNFGNGPRNAENQTQQTHVGTLTGNTGGANTGRLDYNPDTQGGNSGSPVIAEGTDITIGIHTNGGCSASGGTNAGTSFRNVALRNAVRTAQVRTADILWQHFSGQVHYWPMQDGQRLTGVNIASPVGGEWHLAGMGDFNGDAVDDVLWQHVNGQVHYWPIRNGQRLDGLNIAGPVGRDWKLITGGDFNGDGTDDVLWQHFSGQVHYWPIRNGQRLDGINIAGPVGNDWTLIGAGDFNGDGTDDVLWQHFSGQVHYWPIRNGQRLDGINIAGPVGRDWTLIGAGDINGDGTDDVLWQHFSGQVHYWPIRNGQRLDGINIAGPVGNDWRIIAAPALE